METRWLAARRRFQDTVSREKEAKAQVAIYEEAMHKKADEATQRRVAKELLETQRDNVGLIALNTLRAQQVRPGSRLLRLLLPTVELCEARADLCRL